MPSLGMLGFLGGAAGQALKAMETRDEEQRDLRKAKVLEQLRRDTAVFLAEYQDKLDAKKVDDKQSMFDPATGEYVLRNNKGEEIGRRKDQAMREAYDFGKQKDALSLDVARANIRQSDASAEASRASATYSRANAGLANAQLKALNGAGGSGMTTGEAANELMFQAKDATAQARSNGVPQAKIEELAGLAVSNAKTADEARRLFVESLGMYTTPNANAARIKQKQLSLDNMGVVPGN